MIYNKNSIANKPCHHFFIGFDNIDFHEVIFEAFSIFQATIDIFIVFLEI